jgi:hemolysin activation/secretion protein
MNRISLLVCLTLVAFASSIAAEPTTAQAQQIATLAREIQAQQALIAENQAKIDAKLATVAEAVRLARIYASRSGH